MRFILAFGFLAACGSGSPQLDAGANWWTLGGGTANSATGGSGNTAAGGGSATSGTGGGVARFDAGTDCDGGTDCLEANITAALSRLSLAGLKTCSAFPLHGGVTRNYSTVSVSVPPNAGRQFSIHFTLGTSGGASTESYYFPVDFTYRAELKEELKNDRVSWTYSSPYGTNEGFTITEYFRGSTYFSSVDYGNDTSLSCSN